MKGAFRRLGVTLVDMLSEGSAQRTTSNIVWNVLDCRDMRNTIEDILLQLGIQVRVRIASKVRNRHPLPPGLRRLSRWSQRIPFTDCVPDGLDATLVMIPGGSILGKTSTNLDSIRGNLLITDFLWVPNPPPFPELLESRRQYSTTPQFHYGRVKLELCTLTISCVV